MTPNQRKKLPPKLLRTLRGSSPEERILHRLHSVVLVLNGFSCSEVAKCYGDSARSVAYWVERFEGKGLAGLEEEARSGRPSKLTPAQLKKVAGFLKGSQTGETPVDGKALSVFIKRRFGVSLTVRQCRRIVKQFLVS
jgi:transposase